MCCFLGSNAYIILKSTSAYVVPSVEDVPACQYHHRSVPKQDSGIDQRYHYERLKRGRVMGPLICSVAVVSCRCSCGRNDDGWEATEERSKAAVNNNNNEQ